MDFTAAQSGRQVSLRPVSNFNSGYSKQSYTALRVNLIAQRRIEAGSLPCRISLGTTSERRRRLGKCPRRRNPPVNYRKFDRFPPLPFGHNGERTPQSLIIVARFRDVGTVLDRAGSKLLAGWGKSEQALPDV